MSSTRVKYKKFIQSVS